MLFYLGLKRTNLASWINLVILLLASNIVLSPNNASAATLSSSSSLRNILWWLPEDTEMICVMNQAIKPPSQSADIKSPTDFASLMRDFITNDLSGLSPAINNNDPNPKDKLVFAIHGGRKFRAPPDLGFGSYEGCTVFVFSSEVQYLAEQLMNIGRKHDPKTLRIEGTEVVVYSRQEEHETLLEYLAVPKPGILITANNREYLATVLKRIHEQLINRALPDTLPEWKIVNTKASIWALRHYDFENNLSDLTYPCYLQLPNGDRYKDLGAKGLAFDYNDRTKVLELRFLSTDKQAQKNRAIEWQSSDKNAIIKVNQASNTTDGAVVVKIDTSKCRDPLSLAIMILSNLGHIIYT
jgi:hypothetical protein